MAKTAAEKKAESQTSPEDDAQTGQEPEIKSEGMEKVASAQAHVRTVGFSSALRGPSQDDLNPAYAPLTQEEDEAGVKALGLDQK